MTNISCNFVILMKAGSCSQYSEQTNVCTVESFLFLKLSRTALGFTQPLTEVIQSVQRPKPETGDSPSSKYEFRNEWSYRPNYTTTYAIRVCTETNLHFLISNVRRVLYVVCFLLGNSPEYEFYMRTFRNTVPSS